MSTTRKRFLVKGRVQKVGYRDEVQDIARALGVTGTVENLKTGDVEIVCEGEETVIGAFEKALAMKKNLIDVREVVLVEAPPSKDRFEYFEIKHGTIEEELGERMGAGIQYIYDVGQKVDGVGKAVESVGQKVDGVGKAVESVGQKVDGVGKAVESVGQKVDGVGKAIEGVGQKVDGVGRDVREMHTDMNKRFDHMADRYDMIAASLKEAIVHMDRNAEKTDKAIEKSRKETIVAVQKSEAKTARILADSRKEVAASNRELAGAVKFMIRKMSDKPVHRPPSKKRKR